MKHVLFLTNNYPTKCQPSRGVFFLNWIEAAKGIVKPGVISPVFESMRSIGKYKIPKGIQPSEENGVPVYIKQEYNYLGANDIYINKRYVKVALKLFNRYVKEHGKPDLIHAHFSIWAGWAAMHLSKEFGIPYILSEHASSFLKQDITPSRQKKINVVLKHAYKVTAVSKNLSIALKKMGRDDVMLISNSVDLQQFNSSFDDRKNEILTVCHLNANKQVDRLIKAFSRLEKDYNTFTLRIVGDGPERQSLERLCKDLKVDHRVYFEGIVANKNLPGFYKNAKLFVLASKFETFGVVLIEANACGLPVVSCASGGPEDIITPQNGMHCDNNVDSLTSAIQKALKSDWNNKQIRQNTMQYYSISSMREKLKALYA